MPEQGKEPKARACEPYSYASRLWERCFALCFAYAKRSQSNSHSLSCKRACRYASFNYRRTRIELKKSVRMLLRNVLLGTRFAARIYARDAEHLWWVRFANVTLGHSRLWQPTGSPLCAAAPSSPCSAQPKNKKTTQSGGFLFLVHLQGLEPWTHWLRVSCSTSWARGAFNWRKYYITSIEICQGLWKIFFGFFRFFSFFP